MATSQALTLRDDQAIAARGTQISISDVQRLGGLLAASGYFSDAREMAQAAVKVMAGEELGIPPVAAMMGINIIKGKIALGGNLIASRIRAHGYEYRHKQFDNTGCVLIFLGKLRTDGTRETLGESSFTDADARTAQITSDMYKKFPRNMFFNRAISNGARWYTPEVFAGAPVYSPEELGAKVDEQGDFVADEPTQRQSTEARAQVLDRKLAEIHKAAEPVEATAEVAPTPSTLDQILATFKGAASITKAYDHMREHFCKLLDPAAFDAILQENGMGEGGARTIGAAKACFRILWATYEKELAGINAISEQEPA